MSLMPPHSRCHRGTHSVRWGSGSLTKEWCPCLCLRASITHCRINRLPISEMGRYWLARKNTWYSCRFQRCIAINTCQYLIVVRDAKQPACARVVCLLSTSIHFASAMIFLTNSVTQYLIHFKIWWKIRMRLVKVVCGVLFFKEMFWYC